MLGHRPWPELDEGSIPDRVAASATKTVLPNTSKRVVYRVTGGEHEPTGRPDDVSGAAWHTSTARDTMLHGTAHGLYCAADGLYDTR